MRFLCVFFFFFSLCMANAFGQTIAPNPDVRRDSCPYNIIFVLDESGSINTVINGVLLATTVRNGAKALVAGLKGGDARLAIVEFESNPRRVSIGGNTDYQLVDDNYVTNFNTYINGGAGANNTRYNPSGGTNWISAFNLIETINNTVPIKNNRAELIIFFSDGAPGVGTVNANIAAANAVKAQGSHIFVISLVASGPGITWTERICGPDRFITGLPPGTSFLTYDYSLSTTFLLPECR